MTKYYIIRPDGSSIFALPYPEDFCYHCLFLLQNDGIRYKLLSSSLPEHFSLFAGKPELNTQLISQPVALPVAERSV